VGRRKDSNRRFAIGTGVAIGLAFLVSPLVFPSCGSRDPWECLRLFSVMFLLIALPLAVTLSTLERREGRIRWLGRAHTSVAVATVLATWLTLFSVASLLGLVLGIRKLPNVVAAPEFGVVVLLVVLLSSRYARPLLQWSGAAPSPRFNGSRSKDSGIRRAAEFAGVTVSFIAVIVVAWIFFGVLLQRPLDGGLWIASFYLAMIAGTVAFVGFVAFGLYRFLRRELTD